MALELVSYSSDPNDNRSNFVGLRNVYRGQGDNSVFLGIKKPFNKIGNFYIGFDTRIKPAVVRIFYDPPSSLRPPPSTIIGLYQVGQFRIQGALSVPSSYSEDIAYRDKYVDNGYKYVPTILSHELAWMDMISPDTIIHSNLNSRQKKIPFFVYNNILFEPDKSLFYSYPNSNGSVFDTSILFPSDGYSYCASLKSPIGLDFDGPDEELMKEIIEEYIRRNYESYCAGKIFLGSDMWKNFGKDDCEWQKSFFEEIKNLLNDTVDWSNLLYVEQVGEVPQENNERMYLLFKFDDDSGYYPYFCAVITKVEGRSQYSLMLYELDYHLIDEIVFNAHAERCSKTKEFYKENNIFLSSKISELESTGPNYEDDKLEFIYRTYAVALLPDGRIEHLDGLKWEVSKEFNGMSLEFGSMNIKSPFQITSYYGENYSSFRAYQNAIFGTTPEESGSMDTSTDEGVDPQRQWYNVGPRLPLDIYEFRSFMNYNPRSRRRDVSRVRKRRRTDDS